MIKVFSAILNLTRPEPRHYSPNNFLFIGFDWDWNNIEVKVLEEPLEVPKQYISPKCNTPSQKSQSYNLGTIWKELNEKCKSACYVDPEDNLDNRR